MSTSNDRDMIEMFLEMMTAERGVAANTVEAYRRDLIGASQLLSQKLSDAKKTDISKLSEAWRDLASSSVARKSSALRRFFGFLEEEGIRSDNPASALPKPAQERSLPKILDKAEVEMLFTAIAERTSLTNVPANDLRLAALVELLYGSGLRASELIAIPRSAIVSDRPFLILKGKGGKERLVPISDRAQAAVAAWLPLVDDKSPYLFPSRTGHISRIRLFQIIRELAVRAGLDAEKVSPHVLRHAFATHLLAGGANLRALQMMLGHADIATTQIYTHVDRSRLVELVNKRHPLAKRHLTR
jgi:integrase/recombinase XerD